MTTIPNGASNTDIATSYNSQFLEVILSNRALDKAYSVEIKGVISNQISSMGSFILTFHGFKSDSPMPKFKTSLEFKYIKLGTDMSYKLPPIKDKTNCNDFFVQLSHNSSQSFVTYDQVSNVLNINPTEPSHLGYHLV